MPGFKLWELQNGDQVVVCELRDEERRGAFVEVQFIHDGKSYSGDA